MTPPTATLRARDVLGVGALTNASLTTWLHGLPGVDQVGAHAATAVTVQRIGVRKTYKLYIGGAFPRSESGRTYEIHAAGPSNRFLANDGMGSRKDVNAIDLAGGADVDGLDWADLERAAAGNLERVLRPGGNGADAVLPDWSRTPDLSRIKANLETKTIWHPKGL